MYYSIYSLKIKIIKQLKLVLNLKIGSTFAPNFGFLQFLLKGLKGNLVQRFTIVDFRFTIEIVLIQKS